MTASTTYTRRIGTLISRPQPIPKMSHKRSSVADIKLRAIDGTGAPQIRLSVIPYDENDTASSIKFEIWEWGAAGDDQIENRTVKPVSGTFGDGGTFKAVGGQEYFVANPQGAKGTFAVVFDVQFTFADPGDGSLPGGSDDNNKSIAPPPLSKLGLQPGEIGRLWSYFQKIDPANIKGGDTQLFRSSFGDLSVEIPVGEKAQLLVIEDPTLPANASYQIKEDGVLKIDPITVETVKPGGLRFTLRKSKNYYIANPSNTADFWVIFSVEDGA